MEPTVYVGASVDDTPVALSPSASDLFKSLSNDPAQRHVCARASILQDAIAAKRNLPPSNPLPGQSKYERLYEDLNDNEAQWTAILEHDDNHRIAEKIIVVLGTLATIYRQSGHPAEALSVLEVDGRMVERYKAMEAALGPTSFPFPGHSDELNFRYQAICFSAHAELRNAAACAKAFRELCDYEIRHGCCGNPGQPTGNAAFMIGHVLGSKYRTLTLSKLAKLRDEDLWNVVVNGMQLEDEQRARVRDDGGVAPPPFRAGPIDAGSCGLPTCQAVEKVVGEFKRCSRCHEVLYCCREHQKAHWKVHKKKCNK